MLHSFGYVIGEEGKKHWDEFLNFYELIPLKISKEKMDSIRTTFYKEHGKDCLHADDYLVLGIYFQFIQSDKDKILVVKGNSEKDVERIIKGFNLPINKANLSENNSSKASSISLVNLEKFSKIEKEIGILG